MIAVDCDPILFYVPLEESDEPKEVVTKPRPLHVTKSIYVKRVPPYINTADIEEVSTDLTTAPDYCM